MIRNLDRWNYNVRCMHIARQINLTSDLLDASRRVLALPTKNNAQTHAVCKSEWDTTRSKRRIILYKFIRGWFACAINFGKCRENEYLPYPECAGWICYIIPRALPAYDDLLWPTWNWFVTKRHFRTMQYRFYRSFTTYRSPSRNIFRPERTKHQWMRSDSQSLFVVAKKNGSECEKKHSFAHTVLLTYFIFKPKVFLRPFIQTIDFAVKILILL